MQLQPPDQTRWTASACFERGDGGKGQGRGPASHPPSATIPGSLEVPNHSYNSFWISGHIGPGTQWHGDHHGKTKVTTHRELTSLALQLTPLPSATLTRAESMSQAFKLSQKPCRDGSPGCKAGNALLNCCFAAGRKGAKPLSQRHAALDQPHRGRRPKSWLRF